LLVGNVIFGLLTVTAVLFNKAGFTSSRIEVVLLKTEEGILTHVLASASLVHDDGKLPDKAVTELPSTRHTLVSTFKNSVVMLASVEQLNVVIVPFNDNLS
jgi:hypothetical protein